MKKLAVMSVLLCFMLMIAGASIAQAGEIDLLLQKLVEKGVLTGAEAQQVKTETQEQVKKEIAQGKFSSLPAWVQNIKLKGDVRLRYQNQHEKNDNNIEKDVNIGRVRMRLGIESKINEKLLAGIGIATGSGDPRSTNISFGDYNSRKTIVLDYAYGKYMPFPWLNIVGGKMLPGDVFWAPTDLIWDTDINPEGAVIGINKALNPNISLFTNAGFLVVQTDSTSTSGATGFLLQQGANLKFNDIFSLKGALAYTGIDLKDQGPPSSYNKGYNTKYGNTTTTTAQTTGNYAYNYGMLNPAVEFKIMSPFKAIGLNVESLKFFGEYVNNLDVSQKNTGFSAGFQFGNEKIEKWGDWQFRYVYAMLGKDAVLDILPDSDRYSGKTGMRSHEGVFTYGLGKNVSLGFDIYRSWGINGINAGGRAQPETLAQVDFNMKF